MLMQGKLIGVFISIGYYHRNMVTDMAMTTADGIMVTVIVTT